jgi:hypothetical protein
LLVFDAQGLALDAQGFSLDAQGLPLEAQGLACSVASVPLGVCPAQGLAQPATIPRPKMETTAIVERYLTFILILLNPKYNLMKEEVSPSRYSPSFQKLCIPELELSKKNLRIG